jgi:hypothetical protein
MAMKCMVQMPEPMAADAVSSRLRLVWPVELRARTVQRSPRAAPRHATAYDRIGVTHPALA